MIIAGRKLFVSRKIWKYVCIKIFRTCLVSGKGKLFNLVAPYVLLRQGLRRETGVHYTMQLPK